MKERRTERLSAVRSIAKRTFDKVIDPFYAGGAAEAAFFLLLSLVPATILLAQLLHLFTLSMEAAHNLLGEYVTAEVYDLIAPLLDYNPRKSVTVLLVVLALWSGSQAVFTLMRIINRAYGVVPKTGNPVAWVVRERLRAIFTTLLVLVTMVFALYILVYGELIVRASLSYSNTFPGNEYTFSEVWYGARWVIAFILFFIMDYTILYILPRSGTIYSKYHAENRVDTAKNVFFAWLKNRRKASLKALPGSIFASVLMLIATWAYTVWVHYMAFGTMNILYGGLSSVIVLLIWFYVMSYILITGIQLNAACAEYEADRGSGAGEPDEPGAVVLVGEGDAANEADDGEAPS